MNKYLYGFLIFATFVCIGCEQNKNNQIAQGSTRRYEIDPFKSKDRRTSLLDRTNEVESSPNEEPATTPTGKSSQSSGVMTFGSGGGLTPGAALLSNQSGGSTGSEQTFDMRLLDVTTVGADYKLAFDQAQEHMRRGQYQQALVRLDEAKALEPKNVAAYLGEAVCYFHLQNLGKSLAAMEFVVRNEPDNAVYLGNRAMILQTMGDNLGALDGWNVVLKKLPEDVGALSSRAYLYGLLGNHKAAVGDYDLLIRLDPMNSLHFINRGVAYYKQQKFKEAVQDSTKAISLNPKSIDGHLLRALSKALQNDVAGGRPDYDEAVKLGLQEKVAANWRRLFYPPNAPSPNQPSSGPATTAPPSGAAAAEVQKSNGTESGNSKP